MRSGRLFAREMSNREQHSNQKLQTSDSQHDKGSWFDLIRVGNDVIYARVVEQTRIAGETSGAGRFAIKLVDENFAKLSPTWRRKWNVPIFIG